jgi:ABC-type transporter Mla subunit MlaD
MHRSTRLRRLIVAFLVVIILAVAVRFARADGLPRPGGQPSRTALIVASDASHATMVLPR